MAFETIETKHLVDISKKLKKEYPHWLRLVADKMSADKEWKTFSEVPCRKENARHISNGTITSQFHRRLFMKVGAKMLLDVAQGQKETNEIIKQIKKQ